MEILGDRKFVEIPGEQTHELPPIFLSTKAEVARLDRVMEMASQLVDSEELLANLPQEGLLPPAEFEDLRSRRKMDLAVNLVEQYLALVTQWRSGDAILEWIKHCENAFETRSDLRRLLRPDVWPHAGRCSFVTLLSDKCVQAPGSTLEKAVGLRLTFRQPPPLSCFSDQFLLYLNSSVASSAYSAWVHMSPEPISSLPPERFHFDVVNLAS